MARFDALDKQGRDTQSLLAKHVEVDDAVHKTVERHAIYWSVLLLGIPTVGTYVAKKLNWM